MLLPIRTNISPHRTPYVNYALIAINIAVFLVTYGPHRELVGFTPTVVPIHNWAVPLMLTPAHWRIWQFLTYAFLHGGLLHILGNMFFLYLFGRNVNDRLGHFGYATFYFFACIISGLGHVLIVPSAMDPTLGASGAVAAVTGAYLVLYPQTLITVVYWFFFIGTVEVPALYFIAFKLIFFDNILYRSPNIAHDAHLTGYAFGVILTLLLLATRLVRGDHFDLWAMLKRWNRRRTYRDVVSDGYDPFSATGGRRTVVATPVKKTVAQMQTEAEIRTLRTSISQRVMERNLAEASRLYIELMKVDSDQLLPRQYLLDIANQLASDHQPSEAAWAYEQFLKHYGSYEHSEQVELMLGILYARYLDKPEEAVGHLQRAADRLSDPGQIKLCREELARLGA